MNQQHHILVVDDDALNRELIVRYFEKESDYRITEAENAQQALLAVQQQDIDIMLLDIKMPGKDGLELTREIRRFSDVGIILVSVKSDDVDKILGLELGADDYVTKPFNERELFSRTRSLLRRRQKNPYHNTGNDSFQFGNWHFNFEKRELKNQKGETVELSEIEFKLLDTLVRGRGRVLSRDFLMNGIYSRDWNPTDRSIDILISRIRKKLKDEDAHEGIIKTVHGTGYKLSV